jgi:4-amino-4-deoxy-L-arabinose transferase-like glycosyltransferase
MSTQTSLLTTPRPDRPTGADPHDGTPSGPLSGDARWGRPALVGLLVATGALYLWDLGASGWANSFYAAAAQAGSESWKAFFFGSSDAASSITVDKPPASLWVMGLSVRVFGLSSWSLLVPQALMGVASVALLHATVRRTTGSGGAGLLAGAVLAVTPVAVLMFRFDNPDALLVLLLVGSVAATTRALESTRLRASGLTGHPVRWLALGGALVGLAFLTKMLQAFLVLPALVAMYLLAADTPLGRRVGHLLVAFSTMVVSAGWWVAVVALWPADSRPFIGGSQDNSILELTLGYNGFGRLTGDEVGSVGGAPGGGTRWGATGILRMFGSEVGGQVAWLLPAALVLLGAGLWFTRRAPRTDLVRAGLVGWGLWLLVTGLTFSFMAGIFHAYYTVALAPAIGALVGIGATLLWRRRESYAAAVVMACTLACTSTFAFFLLDRTPDVAPWLRWVVAVVGLSAALLLVGVWHLPRRLGLVVAAAALVAGLSAPTAYALDTASTPHTGSIPSAGPTSQGGFRGAPTTRPGGAPTGGLLQGSTSTSAMTALLKADAGSYTWAAAAIGSDTAAGYQLASQEPVMAVGGFNGSDPSPTLAQFERYVADGRIHYFIAGGGGFGGGTSTTSAGSSITSWVTSTFTARTVDGVTVYDLSGGVR